MPDYDRVADDYARHAAIKTPYDVIAFHTFLNVLGPVRGLDILDLATGEGRSARLLMAQGAAHVLGVDISPAMIRRAIAHEPSVPGLRYQVLDARDPTFQLDPPADRVTAMYLLHYAPTLDDLAAMCRLIARNLAPGGRFVTITHNPDFDPDRQSHDFVPTFGSFAVTHVAGPHCRLMIDDRGVDIWQRSRQDHEETLREAGLTDIGWHPLRAPPNRPDLAGEGAWYLANPHCIVLSARRAALPAS
ncbi:MAG: class I SAM-dependent methyltransferase [Pseudomonadota bacterium]